MAKRDTGVNNKCVPPCCICGKVWARKEGNHWVVLTRNGKQRVCCLHHEGVALEYQKQSGVGDNASQDMGGALQC